MNPVLRSIGAAVLRGVLPYPDLARRRRVRRAARRLVVCTPWPADDAVTGGDVAQLALLRLLWLQKQTRRAVRGRHREAAVLLARSSLEACIVGMYCLHCPDAVAQLRAAHYKAGTRLLAFLETADVVPRDVIKQALAALGPQADGPSVKAMATQIDAEIGASIVADLYDRLYVPTSTYFAHANAASLLRHVRADDTLAGRPMVPWIRRSPARLADACVGFLAAIIAHRNGMPSGLFLTYAESHYARTLTPMAVFTGKGMLRSRKLKMILQVIREAVELRRYLSGPAVNDPPQARESRVRALFDKAEALVGSTDLTAAAFRPVVNYLVAKVLREWDAEGRNEPVGQDDTSRSERPR